MVGGGVEVFVSLPAIVGEIGEQLMGESLVGVHTSGIGQQVEAEIAVAAERIGVVVDALGACIRLAFVFGQHRPNQTVGRGIISWLFYPADHLDFRKSAGDAILVGLFSPFL